MTPEAHAPSGVPAQPGRRPGILGTEFALTPLRPASAGGMTKVESHHLEVAQRYRTLSPGTIDVSLSFEERARLTARYGFFA